MSNKLDELATGMKTREEVIEAKVLSKAALELLGATGNMDGQVNGVLGVQAKHDLRIANLEVSFGSIRRVVPLVATAAIMIILWMFQAFYDRHLGEGRAQAQQTQSAQ